MAVKNRFNKINFRDILIISILIISQIVNCIYRKDAFHIFDKFSVLDNVSLTRINIYKNNFL